MIDNIHIVIIVLSILAVLYICTYRSYDRESFASNLGQWQENIYNPHPSDNYELTHSEQKYLPKDKRDSMKKLFMIKKQDL